MDAMAPRRGSDGNGAAERVVNQVTPHTPKSLLGAQGNRNNLQRSVMDPWHFCPYLCIISFFLVTAISHAQL